MKERRFSRNDWRYDQWREEEGEGRSLQAFSHLSRMDNLTKTDVLDVNVHSGLINDLYEGDVLLTK